MSLSVSLFLVCKSAHLYHFFLTPHIRNIIQCCFFSFWLTSLCMTDSAAAAKSLQSCLTLCDPIDRGPQGSPVPGILQARTLEWVAIYFSSAWKWKVEVKSRSRVQLFATPWTAAYQAPPSMGFSRQEYWSGVISFADIFFPLSRLSFCQTYFLMSILWNYCCMEPSLESADLEWNT